MWIKICKMIDERIYGKGYSRGIKDCQKTLKEQKELHENIVSNIEYRNETAMMEKEREIKLLIAQREKDKKARKDTDEKLLIAIRKEKYNETTAGQLSEALQKLQVRMMEPIRDIQYIVDEIQNNGRRDRKKLTGG